MNIPIIVICYNNYKYVKNTLLQILEINKEYYKNIQVLNNNSTCLDTINFLNSCDVKVINNSTNNGPWITSSTNSHVYEILPDKFILTDPDLKLNKNIPNNFIEILTELSDKYKASKVGFALDISDFEEMYQDIHYCEKQTIYEWEQQFWRSKIYDDNYELYDAPIDTTFCLVNKKYCGFNIRVAGNFTAKHLPWYRENDIHNIYENYTNSINTTSISTISKIIKDYIENKYLKVYKNNELFFIESNKNNQNLSFWKNIYNLFQKKPYETFDKYLSKDKIFINIGGWSGTTGMYGSRKSKHVYSIHANNNKSYHDSIVNFKNNCTNYTLINKAVFNMDNLKVKVVKNIHVEDSIMIDSVSDDYSNDIVSNNFYLIETITIESIIKNYQINTSEISLIYVDIEGGEENILNELLNIYEKFNVPLYIRFYHSWWKDQNLDRFSLSYKIKNKIISDPFTFILFHTCEDLF
jgi:FkbM family methyltransferase